MYQEKVKGILEIIYTSCQGDMSKIDPSYLSALDHEYSDGDVCSLSSFAENIDTFDTFEEFYEHVLPLIKGSQEPEFSLPLNFAEDGNDEEMLKQVIGTVYQEGVANVSDTKKKPLSEANNYGFNTEENKWEGFFQGENGKVFSYAITKPKDRWVIEYKLA